MLGCIKMCGNTRTGKVAVRARGIGVAVQGVCICVRVHTPSRIWRHFAVCASAHIMGQSATQVPGESVTEQDVGTGCVLDVDGSNANSLM